MFKKLKEKIAEEVKPLKISQFAQSVVQPGNNAVESPPNEHFSLDDDLPEDSLGNEGFSVVDLHHPSLPAPLSSGRFSRQSSMSSLASDASAFLPIHDASIGTFNMQDLESASEREDALPHMNNLSKPELCNSYLKLYRHYQKYKGRATDLKNFCRELEKDNKKHKTVLLECQEKSLRRIAELKEQCALEQHAKAHLEEALRNDLEEKDHLIQTLQTKIKLLKDAHAANSSTLIHLDDDNLLLTSGDIGEVCESDLSMKEDLQTPQEPLTETVTKTKLERSCEESKTLALKNRVETLKEQIMKDSSVSIQDLAVKVEFQDLLNEISECLGVKIKSSSMREQKRHSNEGVDTKNHPIVENVERNSNLLFLDQLEQNLSESHGDIVNDIKVNSTTVLESIPSDSWNFAHILEQGTSEKIKDAAEANSSSVVLEHVDIFHEKKMKGDLAELENELADLKIKFENATRELEESHQEISERDSTISKLNETLSSLQCELKAYNGKDVETIKSELVETKEKIQELQHQIFFAQRTIKEKDHLIKETNDTLKRNHQELDGVLAQKTEMVGMLNKVQSELADTKTSHEELTYKILNASEETERKESIIDNLNNEIEKINKELEMARSEITERNEMVASLENALKQMTLKHEQITNELNLHSKLVQEKDLIIATIKKDLCHLHKDLDMVSSQKGEANEMAAALDAELKDINHRFEGTAKELESFHVLLSEKDDIISKMKEELTLVHQQLDSTTSLQNQLSESNLELEKMRQQLQSFHELLKEKDNIINKTKEELTVVQQELNAAFQENVGSTALFQNQLSESNLELEMMKQELQSVRELLIEKDDLITKTKGELTIVNQKLDTASQENVGITALLQNQLCDANLELEKMRQELISAHKIIDSKNSHIINIKTCLKNVKGDMETVSAKADKMVYDIQNELLESKSYTEELKEKLNDRNKLIDEKNHEIVNLRQKLEIITKEMDAVSSQDMEKSKTVKEFENDLTDAKVQLGKVTQENNDFHKLLQENNVTITSLNNELSTVRKDLEKALSQKTEECEMRTSLEDKLVDVNGHLELLTQELHSAQSVIDVKDSNYAEISENLCDIRKELDTVILEKAKVQDTLADLEKELINMSSNFKELTEELQSSSKLLDERDLKIVCLTEEAVRMHEALHKMSAEKEEFNGTLFSLKRELTDTKLHLEEVNQEMQSIYHATKEKDLAIAYLTEKLENIQKDLEVISLQKTEACELITDLEIKLKEASLNSEYVSKELQKVHELIEKKEMIITNLTTDLTKTNNELVSTSVLKDESCKLVSTLQSELMDSKLCCDKVSDELKSTHRLLDEKDLYIEKLKHDLEKIQEELNETCILNSEADKSVATPSSELKETKICGEYIVLESANQSLAEQVLEPHVTENVNTVVESTSVLPDENPELVLVLQRKLESNEQELKNMVSERQTSLRMIEEKDTIIKKLEQEVADVNKKLRTFDNEVNTDHTDIFTRTKPSLENSEHSFKSSLNDNEIDSNTSIINSAEQSCIDDHELCSKNTKIKCSVESDFNVKSDSLVLCVNDKKLNETQRQKCSASGTSVIPSEKSNPSCEDNIIVASDISVNNATSSSQVANSVESSAVSEKYSVSENISSSGESSRLSLGVDNLGRSTLRLQNELASWTGAGIPVVKKSTNRNVQEAVPEMGSDDKHLIKELEFADIQNMLDEIQKQNKEYGSLLDCHKSIINHLEGITKLQPEESQPGSAEWLHKQLIALSQKLYATKEKQSIQIASINRLVKHQQDIMKSDNENNMTIEMQYLRNIVFQYMIGKETMLLAKVISAVMKFDPQQLDQVMQKELQKQTLLGQLGLL